MASLFGNLLDRDNPAKKLQREVEGMELKKTNPYRGSTGRNPDGAATKGWQVIPNWSCGL